MRNRNLLVTLLAGYVLLLANARAQADRIVLAPLASTLRANGIKLETVISPYRGNENFSWVQISTPQSIELEYNRWDLMGDNRLRDSFNIQYPVFSDFGSVPAVSIGVRDLLGTGVERQSFYIAAGRSIFLSDSQIKLWKEIKLTVGAGTGRFEGVFLGAALRLNCGVSFNAEIYRYRPNYSIGIPIVRHLEAKAHSLNGQIYYGLTFQFGH